MRLELRYRCGPLRWFGSFLAGVRFSSVTPLDTTNSAYLRKSRLHHAAIMTPLANWYAARIGIGMRVLARPVWLRYEPLMYRLLLERRALSVKGALLLPRLPGRGLLSLLRENGCLTNESELALHLAVVELARLHACRTPHPWDGAVQPFSHADATVENVLVDTERKQAQWIDFETTHDPAWPAPARHADDLLTFLCGAAAAVEPGELPRLCELVLCSYRSKLIAGALVELVRFWEKRPVARRLAIPALSDQRWQLISLSLSPTDGERVGVRGQDAFT